jgi:hypothetical protein
MFPLKCSIEEMNQFIDGSKFVTQGWMTFYWGKTIEEYARTPSPPLNESVTKEWLEYVKSKKINGVNSSDKTVTHQSRTRKAAPRRR